MPFMSGMRFQSRLDGIQALRAIAALLVVCFHLHAAAMSETGSSGLFRIFQRGEIGVDLFFVLSGFIITWSALQKPGLTPQAFLAARFWRVVPPYWAALLAYLCAFLGLALVTGDMSRLPDLAALLRSVLLLPVPDHIVIVAWSLALEVLFYGLFALTWFRADKRIFFGALGIWAIAAFISEYLGLSEGAGLILHAAVPEFLIGVALAWTVLRIRSRGHFPALVLGVALVGLAASGSLDPIEQSAGRSIAFGLPAALVIYGAVGIRSIMPKWVLILGDASYALYLLHLLVFYVTARGVEMLTGVNVYAHPAGLLGLLIFAIGVAVAAHHYAEKPYQRWYKMHGKAKSTAESAELNPAR